MKKYWLNLASSAVVLAGMVLFFTRCEADPAEMDQMTASVAADRGVNPVYAEQNLCTCLMEYTMGTLTAEERDAILFMREEEKVARDVYQAMYDRWNLPVFKNIARAEQRHMDAVGCLIKKYNLTDPVGNNPAGVFQTEAFQKMYDALVQQGNASSVAALRVGAVIEDMDIADLLQRTPAVGTDNGDIKAVFAELAKGSRNHLRAFVNNLTNRGETYVPQYIDVTLFQQIINSPKETGGSLCNTCPNNGVCNGTGNGGNSPGNGTCNGTGNNGNGGHGNGGHGPGNGVCNGTGNGGNGNGGNGNGGNGNGGNGNGGN